MALGFLVYEADTVDPDIYDSNPMVSVSSFVSAHGASAVSTGYSGARISTSSSLKSSISSGVI